MRKLILIVIAVLTLPAIAQERKQDKKRVHKKEALLKDITPEEAASLKVKQMTLHLDLTEAQQQKIKPLLLEEAKLKQQKRDARKATVKENQVKEKPSKDEHLAMINERLDRQIAMKQKMKTILNAEQYKKWEKTQAKKGKRKQKKLHKNASTKKQ